jgi:phage protein D
MLSLPFGSAASVPGMSVPEIELKFGSASADVWAEGLLRLEIQCGLAPQVDVALIVIAPGADAPAVELDDGGTIDLGYTHSRTEPVFAGKVIAISNRLDGSVRVEAGDGGAALAALRLNQSYEQQNAGDIVRDLASRAGADTDTIEDGVELPFFAIDDRCSAYEYVASLAKKSGYLAYFGPEGKLNFLPFSEDPVVRTVKYAEDVLELRLRRSNPGAAEVVVAGQGAAGSEGQDAWPWLTKDPQSVTGKAGSGAPSRLISDFALRSSDAAQAAARLALSSSGLAAATGTLLMPGAPEVVVGGVIEVSDAPAEVLNGPCQVRTVRHLFSKRAGFTTWVGFAKLGGGSGGGLGGLL